MGFLKRLKQNLKGKSVEGQINQEVKESYASKLPGER